MSLTEVAPLGAAGTQLDLFADEGARERERTRQRAINDIKRKFGKNAVLKGIDLLPGATARERHAQIGGHSAGGSDGKLQK